LSRGVAATFQPCPQAADLSRAARPVGTFHDDEFADELLEIDSGDAVTVEVSVFRMGGVGGST
jgi:hypothetical protein